MLAAFGGSCSLARLMADPLDPPHGRPVVLVLRGAQQADLVEVAIRGLSRPGELMGTTAEEKNVEQLLWHGSLALPVCNPGNHIMHRKQKLR